MGKKKKEDPKPRKIPKYNLATVQLKSIEPIGEE